MTKFHRRAIELKYEGYTYREISKAIGHKISEGVLENYFAVDGMLYLEYARYEASMNNWTEEHSRQEYKNLARYTSKIQHSLLKKAIKVGDYRLAYDIIKDINDRAGLVVVRKSEVNVEDRRIDKIETYEQFVEELKRKGIDPGTGLRVATPKVGAN